MSDVKITEDDLYLKLEAYLQAQSDVKRPKLLKESHIEDENMSVKWNREFVENHNKEANAKFKAQLEYQKKAWETYHTSTINYISQQLKCDTDSIHELMEFINDHLDGEGLKYELEHLIELVDIIKDIIERGN